MRKRKTPKILVGYIILEKYEGDPAETFTSASERFRKQGAAG